MENIIKTKKQPSQLNRMTVIKGKVSIKTDKAAETPNMTERIISSLIQYISKEKLREGDKLPTEVALCQMLGVSTRSLREALAGLKTTGVIESRHGTGWYVGQFNPMYSLRFLSPLIQSFSRADASQIMYSRLTIEPRIARLAATNISEKGIAQLKESFDQMQTASQKDAYEEFRMADRQFHHILSSESGNDVLLMINTILMDLNFSSLWWQPVERVYDIPIEDHRIILNAIQSRNPDQAEKGMEKHLRDTWELIQKKLEQE